MVLRLTLTSMIYSSETVPAKIQAESSTLDKDTVKLRFHRRTVVDKAVCFGAYDNIGSVRIFISQLILSAYYAAQSKYEQRRRKSY